MDFLSLLESTISFLSAWEPIIELLILVLVAFEAIQSYYFLRDSRNKPKMEFTASDSIHIYVSPKRDPAQISFYVSITNRGRLPIRDVRIRTWVELPRAYYQSDTLLNEGLEIFSQCTEEKFDIDPHPIGESPFLNVLNVERRRKNLTVSTGELNLSHTKEEQLILFQKKDEVNDLEVKFSYRSPDSSFGPPKEDFAARIRIMVVGASDLGTVMQQKSFKILVPGLGTPKCDLLLSSIRKTDAKGHVSP